MGLGYFGDLALSLTIGYLGVFGFLCAAQIINHELFSKRSRNNDEEESGSEPTDESSDPVDMPVAEEEESLNLLKKLDQALKENNNKTGIDSIEFDGPSTSKAAFMRNKYEKILAIEDNKKHKSNENARELIKPITEPELLIERDNEAAESGCAVELKIEPVNEQSIFIEEAKKSEEYLCSKRSIENNSNELKNEETISGLIGKIANAQENLRSTPSIDSEFESELKINESSSPEFEEINSITAVRPIILHGHNEPTNMADKQNQSHFNDNTLQGVLAEKDDEQLNGLEIRVQLYVPRSFDLFSISENQNNNIVLSRKEIDDEEHKLGHSDENSVDNSEELIEDLHEKIYGLNDHDITKSLSSEGSLGFQHLDDVDQYITVQEELLELNPSEKQYSSIEELSESESRLGNVIDVYENSQPTTSEKSVESISESCRDKYGLLLEGVSDFYDFQASTNPSRSRNVSPFNSRSSSSNNNSTSSYSDISIRNEDKAADVLTPEEIIEMRELVDSLRVAQHKLEELRRSESLSPAQSSRNISSDDEKGTLRPERNTENSMQTLRVEAAYSQRRSRSRSPLPTENNLQKSLEIRRSKLIQQNDDVFEKLGVKVDGVKESSIETQIGECELISLEIPTDTEILTQVPVLHLRNDVNEQNTLLTNHSEKHSKNHLNTKPLELTTLEDTQNNVMDDENCLLISESARDIERSSDKNTILDEIFSSPHIHMGLRNDAVDLNIAIEDDDEVDDKKEEEVENTKNTYRLSNRADHVYRVASRFNVLETIMEEEEEEEEEDGIGEIQNTFNIRQNFASRPYYRHFFSNDEDFENIDDISSLSFDEELELSESEYSESDYEEVYEDVGKCKTRVCKECNSDMRKMNNASKAQEGKEKKHVDSHKTELPTNTFSVLSKYKAQFDNYPLIENESESCLVLSDDDSIEISKQHSHEVIFTDNGVTSVKSDIAYKPKREYNWRKNFKLNDEEASTSTVKEQEISIIINKEIQIDVLENEKDNLLKNSPQELNKDEKIEFNLTQKEKNRNEGSDVDSSLKIETDTVENFNTMSTLWILTKEGDKVKNVSPYDMISSSSSSSDSESNESIIRTPTLKNNNQNKEDVEEDIKTSYNQPKKGHVMEGLSDFYDFLRIKSDTTSNHANIDNKSENTSASNEKQIAVAKSIKIEDNNENNKIKEIIQITANETVNKINIENVSSENPTADLQNVMENFDILKDANLYPFV